MPNRTKDPLSRVTAGVTTNFLLLLILILVVVCCQDGCWAFQPLLHPTSRRNQILRRRSSNPGALHSTTEEEISKTTDETTTEDRRRQRQEWRRPDLFGSSLIEDTVQNMEKDVEYQRTAAKYAKDGAAAVTREERAQRRRALDKLGIPSFTDFLEEKTGITELHRKESKILQVNIGLYCNQACAHCHVESSPLRTEEMMATQVAVQILKLLKQSPTITTLDITGGAPELNANFRYLVATARELRPDIEIIDRCNLTVLQEPGQEDLIDFLKQHRVRIVASLPCYSEANVDQQRGNGVFERSIAALLALNEAGYGKNSNNGPLKMDLVYNPGGAFLPPAQESLQEQYKQQLLDNFGITFDDLFTMTNMPIKRFADYLHRNKELETYMDLLVQNFNPDTIDSLMCRDTISINYDGKIFDCDFNQQLGYGMDANNEIHKGGLTVFDVENVSQLQQYSIRNDNHCFGCTAGMGSS